MSFIHETAERDHRKSFAGGIADFGDVYDAVREQLILIDNFNASEAALDRAYQERIDSVRNATGIELDHPIRQMEREFSEQVRQGIRARDRQASERPALLDQFGEAFHGRLAELEKQFPDHAETIRAGVPISQDVSKLVQGAEARAGQVIGSRDDFVGKWGAVLAGGFAGSLRDPLNVASLFLGAGSAARTAGGRILSVALKEAAINAGVELAAQPIVQDWRKQNGLDSGFLQAAENVALAAAFGGAFGAAGRGVGEFVSRGARRAANEQAFDVAAADLPDDNPLKGLDALPPSELAEQAALPRPGLPAEARGAADFIQGGDVAKAYYRPVDPAAVPADQLDVALRDRARVVMGRYVDAKAKADAFEGEGPNPHRHEVLGAESDLVETFRQVGLPGDTVESGPRRVDTADDIIAAFDRAAPEELDRYWLRNVRGRQEFDIDADDLPDLTNEQADDLADRAAAWAEAPERGDLDQTVSEAMAAAQGRPRPDPRPDPREGTRNPERTAGGVDDLAGDVEDPEITAVLDGLDPDELDEIPVPAGADGEGVEFISGAAALRDANRSNELADLVDACKVI